MSDIKAVIEEVQLNAPILQEQIDVVLQNGDIANITADIEEVQINAPIVEEQIDITLQGAIIEEFENPLIVNAGQNITVTDTGFSEIEVATVDDPDFTGINLDTVNPITISTAGQLAWNEVDGTVDIGLKNNVKLKTGQQLYFYGKAQGAITKKDVVQFAGFQGDHILIKKAVGAEIEAFPEGLIGVAKQSLTNGQFGYVTWFGEVAEISTTGWAVGDILYFDNATGGLTNVAPTAPNRRIVIAAVEKLATGMAQNGVILVRPTFGLKLKELDDVNGTALTTTGQILSYNASTGYFDFTENINNKVSKSGDTMTGVLTITGAGLTVDSADNTLVVDATNNRVGIGTATPAQALDVVGQVVSSSFFRTNLGLTNNSSGNNATIRPQTGGTLIDRNVADGNPVLRVQNLNVSSTGDVLRLQDFSTNNLVTVDKDGQMTLNSRSSSRALNVVPQVNTGSSTTTGGAVRVDNTNNTGSGMLLYSNAGSGRAGRLIDMNIANAAFDKAGFHMDYAGVANAFEIANTGTGTANQALNVVSNNSSDSAVGIAGAETSKGTVKITHNKPTGTDAGSSALSLRTNGTGTAAHMIFGDAENGGTTGDIMLMRQNGVNAWRIDKDGTLQVGIIPTARVQNLSGTNTGDQNTFSTIAVAGQSNVVADSTSDTLTLVAGSNITLTTNATNDTITISSTGGGSAAETFETVSKNFKSWNGTLTYTGGVLTSIVYTDGVDTITKTLNYTGDTLTSIVLSGDTPAGIDLTKTLGYTSGNLTSIIYS